MAFDDHIQRIRFMMLYESDFESMYETISNIDPTVSKDDFWLFVNAAKILDSGTEEQAE